MKRNADRQWFLNQVEREHARVRASVRALGVRADHVDDLAQDAFVIAFEKRTEFDRSKDFGAWVRGIAKHLVLNERRKEARRSRLLAEHLTEVLADQEVVLVSQPVSEERRLTALRTCLKTLPEESRELVHYRYFEELSPVAIGQRLERSSNDIRQALLRLRRKLLTCVQARLNEQAF